MEFFDYIDIKTNEASIQDKITPESIDIYCPSMFLIEEIEGNYKMGTIWGEFICSFNKITGGIRLTLLDCPNALALTITTGYPPERQKITLHATINRTRKPAEFIEEINEFLKDWKDGLMENFQ